MRDKEIERKRELEREKKRELKRERERVRRTQEKENFMINKLLVSKIEGQI